MKPTGDGPGLSAAEVWLPTGPEMTEIDRTAIAGGGVDERTLIEAAGREIARRVSLHWPRGSVCALVGSGHNGADAVAACRSLMAWGRQVRCVQAGSSLPEPDTRHGWPIELEKADFFVSDPPREGVLLDGILGTGATGSPRPDVAAVIEGANATGLPVASVDGPSGADLTTGAVPGTCVRAELTVCLGWPKLGLLRYPAREFCGRIEAVEIGFPPVEPRPAARLITARWARALLRARPAGAHKGTSGYLLLVAGDTGMAGAAVLAARSAYRAGAGIVRIAAHPANREIVQSAVPGAVFEPWNGDPGPALDWSHALAIGPGMGRGGERRDQIGLLLAGRQTRPAVIDADGLNAFEGASDELVDLVGPGDVLTPHPGEMARLAGSTTADVLSDPISMARAASARFECVVLLKGTPTVIASPNGDIRVASTGGPGVAVGGTGDVLTGAVGAYLAAGYPALDAASVALQVTGMAASGGAGLVAEDIPDRIPAARASLERMEPRSPDSLLFVSDPA